MNVTVPVFESSGFVATGGPRVQVSRVPKSHIDLVAGVDFSTPGVCHVHLDCSTVLGEREPRNDGARARDGAMPFRIETPSHEDTPLEPLATLLTHAQPTAASHAGRDGAGGATAG